VPEMAAYDSAYYGWGFNIHSILVDPGNTIYFTCNGTFNSNYLFIFNNGKWTILQQYFAGSPFYLEPDTVNLDTLWYGSGLFSGYFIKPDYKGNTFSYELTKGMMFGSTAAVAIDKDNFVWFGYYSGVVAYTRSSLIKYPSEITGVLGSIKAITVDKYNRKWFGSQAGITCYNGQSEETYAPEGWKNGSDGSNADYVNALAFDDDGVMLLLEIEFWGGYIKENPQRRNPG